MVIYTWGCTEDLGIFTTEQMEARMPELLRKAVIVDPVVMECAAALIERRKAKLRQFCGDDSHCENS